MGWARTLFLGDIGNRLDIEDTERDVAELRRRLRSKSRADVAQDKRIDALERENEQLKLYLASLVRLLVSEGTLKEKEIEAFVDVVERDDSA